MWELRVFVAPEMTGGEAGRGEGEEASGEQRQVEEQASLVLDERSERDVKAMLSSPAIANVGTDDDRGGVERRSDTYLVASPSTGLKFVSGRTLCLLLGQRKEKAPPCRLRLNIALTEPTLRWFRPRPCSVAANGSAWK